MPRPKSLDRSADSLVLNLSGAAKVNVIAAPGQLRRSASYCVLENLLDITEGIDFEDYGSLRLRAVESDGDSVRLSLHITADEYPDRHQNWQVLCSAVKEQSLSLGIHYDLKFLDDHVLLWPHLAPRTSTSFYGKSESPLAVIGALYQRHRELVGEWLPFHRFLNSSIGLSELISGGFGMLAEGPEPLVVAYEEVMRAHGFSASHLDPTKPVYGGGTERLGQNAPAFVLILDDSYVVAEQFAASPV